ncbi:MAG TPA: hypothetical protein VMU88_05100, partial [bacterium]|nr:hypothetical protein [bacterium]
KIVQNVCLVLCLGMVMYLVQPILSATESLLEAQWKQMSPQEMTSHFLEAARDLPRDEAFAKTAERLMEKYSKGKKFPVYFFGERGIEVAMYDGRSKAYPYEDIVQAAFIASVRNRILSTDPNLKNGDCIYTSPDMNESKAMAGSKLNLEQTLFRRLNSRYVLRPVETSGTITVYKVLGEKNQTVNPRSFP